MMVASFNMHSHQHHQMIDFVHSGLVIRHFLQQLPCLNAFKWWHNFITWWLWYWWYDMLCIIRYIIYIKLNCKLIHIWWHSFTILNATFKTAIVSSSTSDSTHNWMYSTTHSQSSTVYNVSGVESGIRIVTSKMIHSKDIRQITCFFVYMFSLIHFVHPVSVYKYAM